MTKPTKRIVDDYKQMSLLDLLLAERDELTSKRAGRMCISAKLLAAVKKAIKEAPKSRDSLADEMTELSGAEITVHMINSWCADSHPHRLPAEFIPALVSATGNSEPLRIMCEATGLFTVAGPDALRAEMQKDVEAKRKIEKDIRQKEALIKALEGKQ
jgi:hypothetical protein